jgi:hypothetical protein
MADTVKRSFKLSVGIARCPTVFIEGDKPGVVGSVVVTFELAPNVSKARLHDEILDHLDKLRDEMIFTNVEEIQND